uniref:F-box/LRR-repeat protein 15/At3g58940/PEG3-like LRR domain-containing protein n=1 Tax=Aegilops tauschii subsp. strangulata TaxID=200361 RepID=A0A453NEF9_AEGTS
GQEEALAKWLRLLVAKGVESLVLVNRPWPLDVALPASILRCASLRRLYLGVWHFPDTSRASAPPRGPGVFPRLQELGICHTIMQERDLEYLLACSPELKTFALILSYAAPSLVPISSSSLCCVLVWLSMPYEVDVVAAPRLQRLILQSIGTIHTTKVKIGHAPELTVLGYLETANHVLQIGNTIIKV